MNSCKGLSAKLTPYYLSVNLFQLSRIREFLLTLTLSCLNWRNICKLKFSKWSSVIKFIIFFACYYIRIVILYLCKMFTLLSVCGIFNIFPLKKITWYIMRYIMWYILWYILYDILYDISCCISYDIYIIWYIVRYIMWYIW